MGKQAKKKNKTEAQVASQRRHNRATRGINTKKQGALWAIREYKVEQKNEDGKKEVVTETEEVRVPYDAMWNPFDSSRYSEFAPEPFDALQLNFVEELQHYAVENEAKLDTLTLDNGRYLHRVIKESKNPDDPDEVLLQIESSRKLMMNRGPRRRSRRKA